MLGVCYAPSTDLGTVVVDMAIGETRDDFSGHLYNPNKFTGETIIMYKVFNEIDPDDSASFYVNM